ncbi:hypothetical protein F5Y15DRAFT_419006 [Xylariaceae sp. FL0016]|nr:hypothetical protein F5Y15DRAFT_419006 [Xylariaceae sp. FL0016]
MKTNSLINALLAAGAALASPMLMDSASDAVSLDQFRNASISMEFDEPAEFMEKAIGRRIPAPEETCYRFQPLPDDYIVRCFDEIQHGDIEDTNEAIQKFMDWGRHDKLWAGRWHPETVRGSTIWQCNCKANYNDVVNRHQFNQAVCMIRQHCGPTGAGTIFSNSWWKMFGMAPAVHLVGMDGANDAACPIDCIHWAFYDPMVPHGH